MQNTPKGFRLHIGLFGRRNVGKSSLLNAITRQEVSIVSEVAGTTTDPVEKPMEFLPLGPVLFIDTAGIDDLGALGELRIQKTKKVFDRADVGVIITEADIWGEFEEQILHELKSRQVPIVIVLNKIDVHPIAAAILNQADAAYKPGIKIVSAAAKINEGLIELRQALLDLAPEDFINHPAIVRDLVGKDELAILVTPIDKEAPKGRLILPEVQVMRDLLDGNAYCIVTQQAQLQNALIAMCKPPKLVITDSQCFREVAAIVPNEIYLTSFSILFSRFKGDLISQVIDTCAIDALRENDRVLICEACSHHPIGDDIGREKIPKLLMQRVGARLNIKVVQGYDFPDNISDYKLIIHCGACMWNRRALLSRILQCKKLGVPFSNYGLAIAHCAGILERALKIFPEAQQEYLLKINKK